MNQVSNVQIDPKKKAVFSILLIFIPVLFFLFFELFLRVFNYGDSYDLFVDQELSGKVYRRCNIDYGKKYFHSLPYTSPYFDPFLKDKPKNSFRLFVIGSSTAYGFPYGSGIRFSKILSDRLQDNFPDKNIEMVNIAITAINSFTFQDIINEILEEEPDALLIYAGHNEFYGGLGIGSKDSFGKVRWLKIVHLKLLKFRTYQLIRTSLFKIQNLFNDSGTSEHAETGTLMERSISNRAIGYKTQVYQKAHTHYRKNMSSILKQAQKEKVPVFFSEVISNVKDLPPFASLDSVNYPAANQVFNQAIDFEEKGLYREAQEAYYEAKDLDGIRFRAASEINSIINSLANEYRGVSLVPMGKIFEANSENGLIGNNLLTEHVHPNIDGYFLLADAFYNSIIESSIIGKSNPLNIKSVNWYRNNWGYTALDSLAADILVRKLKAGWPFQPDSIENNFIHSYQPASLLDSLAYQSVRYDDISIESAHKTLAKYYIIHDQPDKAVAEYSSILKSDPFGFMNYNEVGDILFDSKKYREALSKYEFAYFISSDSYSLSRIGEVNFLLGEFQKAIPFLEEVHKKVPEFKKRTILTCLYVAYQKTNQLEKADDLYAANSTILSDQQSHDDDGKEIILRLPREVNELIQRAIVLLQKGNANSAFKLLLQANQISETSIANRLLGDIFLVNKNKEALAYLKKVYFDYKTDPEYLNTLFYASIIFEDFQYAAKILPDLKQLDPDNPNISKYKELIEQNN